MQRAGDVSDPKLWVMCMAGVLSSEQHQGLSETSLSYDSAGQEKGASVAATLLFPSKFSLQTSIVSVGLRPQSKYYI